VTATEDSIRAGTVALSMFFVGAGTLGATLTRVAELARDALSADMAGITMLVEGRSATAVFTDPDAVEVDRPQYDSDGRGPCVDAFRLQTVFRIADTATDERWPEFATSAAAHGIRSTLSLPLTRSGEPLGALNLYSRSRASFDADTGAAETLALQAAIVLFNAQVYHDSREVNENLNQALTSRRTIDYAIGLLMAAGGRSPEDAFQVLVRASQRENRKLREIAAEIVSSAQARAFDPPAQPVEDMGT
jgi:GAF domain-containing protein